MKKYIAIFPLMLFPYAYLIALFIVYAFKINDIECFIIASMIYVPITLICTVSGSIHTGKGKLSLRKTAKMNLWVKGIHIPAYIFHFLAGMTGLVMSVWGIGIILFAIAIDLATIILSGIFAIGCFVRVGKEKVIPIWLSIFLAIGSFIYCIDVVIAIGFYIFTVKREKKENLSET